jgi:hypothetical protein
MIFRFVIASKIVLLSFANHFGGNLLVPSIARPAESAEKLTLSGADLTQSPLDLT